MRPRHTWLAPWRRQAWGGTFPHFAVPPGSAPTPRCPHLVCPAISHPAPQVSDSEAIQGVTTEAQREAFVAQLTEAEDWLYGDGEAVEGAEYR